MGTIGQEDGMTRQEYEKQGSGMFPPASAGQTLGACEQALVKGKCDVRLPGGHFLHTLVIVLDHPQRRCA
jgi:hypothetical protein